MMSRSDAAIVIDLAQAACQEAMAAITRKCELLPVEHRLTTLRLAFGMLAQRQRAMARVFGASPVDDALRGTDSQIEAQLRQMVEASS